MCPDAHGAEQKALFKLLDISGVAMRIEGMGQRRVDGFAARTGASGFVSETENPITQAFEKLFSSNNTIPELEAGQGLVTVCFAKEAPPTSDTDGPFYFMPGFFVDDSDRNVEPPRDSVTIPAQTYLVTTWSGLSTDIGNFRFTLTEEFWPKTAPFLGLGRVDGPNIMIWPPGQSDNETSATVEMWTPIKAFQISSGK